MVKLSKTNGDTNGDLKQKKTIVKKRKISDTNNDANKSESNSTETVAKKKKLQIQTKENVLKKTKSQNVESSTEETPSSNKKPKTIEKKPLKNGKSTKTYSTPDKKEKKIILKKKELKKERRKSKLSNSYNLNVDLKKIWETLRQSETTDEVRKKLCRSVHERLKGNVKNMVYAHDTTRVIQCLIEYGNETQRETVFEEIKDDFVDLAKSQYSRFVVEKLLNYGTKEQKEFIINSFTGHVTKLIKHSYACKIIESIFNEHANKKQRNQMLNEFYGLSMTLFKDNKYESLSDVLNDNLNQKETILSNVKEILQTCIEKSILMFSIVHRVFVEYFKNCDQKMKNEMIDLLSERLVNMIHTKDGCHVAMQCIWFSTAKQRKVIVKAFKSFIEKIACDEHGHLILIAIFDSVDDTKFVSKCILDELLRSIDTLFANDYGRKILKYLITGRDKKFFIPDYLKQLEYGDKSETSKKPLEIRHDELLTYSLKSFKDYLNKNLNVLLTNGANGILIPEVISKFDGDSLNDILANLANILLAVDYEPNVKTTESNNEHIIENATAHYIMKHIIVSSKSKLLQILLQHSNVSYMKNWCYCNRGCFILVKMIEESDTEFQTKLKAVLNQNYIMKELKNAKFTGAKILLEKLNQIK